MILWFWDVYSLFSYIYRKYNITYYLHYIIKQYSIFDSVALSNISLHRNDKSLLNVKFTLVDIVYDISLFTI